MKNILIEIDDRMARELERVAPTRKRMRAEFVRLAIRSALDRALDRATEAAYAEKPLASGFGAGDLAGWDDQNELAVAASRGKKARGQKSGRSAA
jgi:hypothetical protein